jgi:hypothetical protein
LINIDPGFCSEQAVQIGVLAEDSFHAVVTQMPQTRETVRLSMDHGRLANRIVRKEPSMAY